MNILRRCELAFCPILPHGDCSTARQSRNYSSKCQWAHYPAYSKMSHCLITVNASESWPRGHKSSQIKTGISDSCPLCPGASPRVHEFDMTWFVSRVSGIVSSTCRFVVASPRTEDLHQLSNSLRYIIFNVFCIKNLGMWGAPSQLCAARGQCDETGYLKLQKKRSRGVLQNKHKLVWNYK